LTLYPELEPNMVMKLYGAAHFTCTKRVVTILKETNTPYELIVVDFAAGEHKTPAYLEKQPFGQLPYLEVSSHHP
jgi:glutathione S-transferase